MTAIPPNQRRFVIVEQDKYQKLVEEKKEGGADVTIDATKIGELSIIKKNPKNELNKKPLSRAMKKLGDHSLTRMTKRSFKLTLGR